MDVCGEIQSIFLGQASLLGQIEKTLLKEALDDSEEGFFYTGLRHVFAEIDGLGKLYAGERGTKTTTENAIAFAVEYLGRVNSRYRDLFGLLVDMYRHGLAHTHLTKSVKFRAQNHWITVGWAMSDEKRHRGLHLTLERKEPRFFRLWLHIPRLVEDALEAIKLYRSDLRKLGQDSTLFKRFKLGYEGTAAVFQEPPPLSTVRKRPRKPKQKPPLSLKHYSTDGLAWLRNEIAAGRAWKVMVDQNVRK